MKKLIARLTPATWVSLVTLALAMAPSVAFSAEAQDHAWLKRIDPSSAQVILASGEVAPPALKVTIQFRGNFYVASIENGTTAAHAIREVILFDFEHGWPGETLFYGEGYTMLSQTGGTLAQMMDLDEYTDRGHYRLAEPSGYRTVYGMMRVTPPGGSTTVFGFSSCKRFVGKFHINGSRLRAALDTENLILQPGERWDLEEVTVLAGRHKDVLLAELAARINRHHPRLAWPKLPTGWCSWYCFGPNVTASNILDNLAAFKKSLPEVRYIQIDDGYQPWMGDWLEPNHKFKGGIRNVVAAIRQAGFEPAIWVAPFIASPQSRLFREHPDWFVKDAQGQPLRSDKVTFGGWRQGPWYMLDGTHPEAQSFLEQVFRTMRQEWGVTYFKLDANVWGAFPFGHRHDPRASCVEAYRRGMAALRRGSGDAYLLACNHPLWPTLGEAHGCRSSMDVGKDWGSIQRVARENLLRNWQNNRLWWNDPDCLLLNSKVSDSQESFHLAATYATGGMLLSGDDVTRYSPAQWNLLRKAAQNPGIAAVFENDRLEVGAIEQGDHKMGVLLNWHAQSQRRALKLDASARVLDFWTGEDLGIHQGEFVLDPMPGQSGRLVILKPVAGEGSKEK